MIHVEPILFTVRCYQLDKWYGNKDPYEAVLTVQMISPTKAYVSGLHGTMTKEWYKEITNWLRKKGVIEMHVERHGKYKVIKL